MSLLKNAGSMSVAVMISRVFGLLREQVFAYFFGAGMASDAYLVAFRVPNLLRDLLAEGALSSAFVSVFAKTTNRDRQKALASHVMVILSLVLLALCLLIALGAEPIVSLMADGFHSEPGKFELTVSMTRLLSPFLFLVSSAALAMGILNSLGSFFIPSMGSAAFNLGNIIVGGAMAYFLMPQGVEKAVWGFCFGTLVGGFVQWSVQWPKLRSYGFTPTAGLQSIFSPAKIRAAARDSDLRKILAIMAPSILAVAAVQINVLVNTSFAADLGSGSVAWLNFSYRIMHFPMGIFGVALSTATLPRLAKLLGEGKQKEFGDSLEQALKWTAILAIGSAFGMWCLGEPIVALLYERGRFTRADTLMTAQTLAAYSFGLLAFNGVKIFVQAFYALDKVWIPSTISLLAIVTNYFGNYWMAPLFGVTGLALTTSMISFFNLFVLGVVLQRMGCFKFSWRLLRVVSACLVGVLPMVWIHCSEWPQRLLEIKDSGGTMAFAAALVVAVVLLALAFFAIVAALTPEGRALVTRLRRPRAKAS